MRKARRQNLDGGVSPYYVPTTVQRGHRLELDASIPILLPHELVHGIWCASPQAFETRFVGDRGADGLREFWNRNIDDPWVLAHPSLADIRKKPEACIPVRIWGDDAPLGRSRSMMCVQCCSVMCSQVQVWMSRFLMMAITLDSVVQGATLEPLYDAIAWSFEVLASGFMPHRDHLGQEFSSTGAGAARRRMAGKPCCGGYLLLFAQFLGDWKWLKEELRLKSHYNVNQCCWMCFAEKRGCEPAMSAFNYAEDAGWCQTHRTHEEYMAQPVRSALCGCPGWHLSTVKCDLMHLVLLGILQHAIGGVMWELCWIYKVWRVARLPGTKWKSHADSMLHIAYVEFREWATLEAQQCSQPLFKVTRLSMDTLGDSACFKSKAANTLKVGYWLAAKTKTLSEAAPHDRHLALCACMLWGYTEIFSICREAGQWLSEEEAAQMDIARQAALFSNHALSAEMVASGVWRFPQKPKHHATDHCLRLAAKSKLNPAWHWCFADEDFIGKMKKLGNKVPATNFSLRLIERYVIRLFSKIRSGESA